ncbi:MAG: ROK family protein [Myxococcota bacterium]
MFVGFDVGDTNARLSLFDEEYRSTSLLKRGVREDTSPEGIATLLADMLADALAEHGASLSNVHAIGIGLAGQMSSDGRLIYNAPNLHWRDVHFAHLLEAQLEGDVSVRVVNDLNALLWGEYIQGAARDAEDVLAMYVGTGVGGAMVAGGRLLHGAGGKAGEIGHTKFIPRGRLCNCGERGCTEAYAGGLQLEMLVAQAARSHDIHEVWRTPDRDAVDLAAADRLAQHRHPDIHPIFDLAADALSLALANAITLLNPELVVLGGGVLTNSPFLRQGVMERARPLVRAACREDCTVARPEHGDIAGMLGAAQLAADMA